MIELYVFCEGPTEQRFCNLVLRTHLFPVGNDGVVHTPKIANSKRRGVTSRGGIGKYATLRRDISNELRRHRRPHVFFTTMIDLYGLPKDFPGKADRIRDPANPTPYVKALEAAFQSDIDDDRFIPYLQLHEYETLLFADPDALVPSFENCQKAVREMKAIVSSVLSIEHIDDGESTAPSKRITAVLPAYSGRKTSAGPQIAERIGMPVLREKCPHFHDWISRLEQTLRV